MRNRLIAAVAGLALLLGGSVALVAWLTRPPPAGAQTELAPPPEPSPPLAFPAPVVAPTAAPAPRPGTGAPPAAAAPLRSEPDAEFPTVAGRQEQVQAIRKQEAALRRHLRVSLREVEPKVAACAREGRAAPGARRGRTVLAVQLEVRDGRAQVVDVLVHRRGPDVDPVLHCARGAIMGESFPVPASAGPGTAIEVLLPLPVPGDDPGRAAR